METTSMKPSHVGGAGGQEYSEAYPATVVLLLLRYGPYQDLSI